MSKNPQYQKRKQDLNHLLYEKVQSELAVFQKEILTKTPEEIYEAAHEIAVKHEIAKVFAGSDYSPISAAVLLKSENLLQDIYDEWQKDGVWTKDGMKRFTGYVDIYRKHAVRKEINLSQRDRASTWMS